MKKLLILTALLFSLIVNAQIVNIPDANFKAGLITNGVDTNNDGEIQESEASSFINLYLNGVIISDLTGIEAFINLEILDCQNSNLTSLNLSNNVNLKEINCRNNQITGNLDFSNNLILEKLNCSENNFTNINVSNCINLNTFSFYDNSEVTTINSSGCINLVNLKMYHPFITLTSNLPNLISIDISNCPLITEFYVQESQLNSLNVSGCIGLTYVDITYTQLTTLDLSGLYNLQGLLCFNNQLTTLNISGCNNLIYISCSNNFLAGNFDISNHTQLTQLYLDNNNLTSINTSNCSSLTSLSIYTNVLLQSLNTSGCTNLLNFSMYDTTTVNVYPNLTTVNISNCHLITQINIQESQLNSLNVSGCNGITYIDVTSTQLTSLDLTGLINLENLFCFNNQITTLNVSGCINLMLILAEDNQLTTLDVSSNLNLTDLSIYNNLLTSLYTKNGANESISFSGNPNLNFICVDETQVATIQSQLDSANMTNIVCNSFCTFTPGGNYNTITGNVKIDANNDGCDTLDNSQAFVRLNISDGTTNNAVFTNNLGNYNKYVYAGNYTITPILENQINFTVSPINTSVSFPNNNDNVATQNFCLSPIAVFTDAEIVIAPTTTARPGFDATYLVTYKNKGNVTISGQLSFNYNDTILDLVSPAFQSPGVLIFNYTNLLPLESRSFYVTLNVNSPTETPAVNIGDILNFSAAINTTLSDEIPSDNLFIYNQTVVGSFDPNDITCIEGESVSTSEIGNYLHYIVNFENTGTFQAENIVVKTTIDPNQFDINSLQLLSASNQVDARITGNVVEFIFNQIMLDTGGHGNVLLKVKSKNNLLQGDIVSKRADIFFDYNFPVDTGFANTTFQSLNNSSFLKDNSISVYPNPANSIVNIKANSNLKSIQLYDVQGRILQTKIVNQTNEVLDISSQSNGIYFLKITSDDGVKVEQIVKE